MRPEFTCTVHQIGLSVAALMTTDMIKRRLTDTFGADKIILPGRFRGDLDELSAHFGVPCERGPEELKDLPAFFGRAGAPPSLDEFDLRIFAEIVEAPTLTPEQTLDLARGLRDAGADVVDLGALPDTPFDRLEDCVALLKREGFAVSVDSHDPDELLRAARAGADYLMSLKEDTLWVADQTDAVPVLLPDSPADIASLERAIEKMRARGKPFIADPVLDPIHCGFSDSLARYHGLRARHPDIEIMMGVGNLTELTHADTVGVNALLLGIASELGVRYMLTTQVSGHCARAVREADVARRIMYRARAEGRAPTKLSDALMCLRERHPFPYTGAEIDAWAAGVKDRNFRIQTARDGIHVYNRDMHKVAGDPFDFYPELGVEDDGAHAFYLGVELGRAQIAWQLGKRYAQDEELAWGCATDRQQEDRARFAPGGATWHARRRPKSGARIDGAKQNPPADDAQ